MSEIEDKARPYQERAFAFLLISAVASVASLASPAFALLALLLFVISVTALFGGRTQHTSATKGLAIVSLMLVFMSLGIFSKHFVLPGIVRSGESAMVKNALSELRHIQTAQRIAREQAVIDLDQDGIGAALTFEELLKEQENGASLLRHYGRYFPDTKTYHFSGYQYQIWFDEGLGPTLEPSRTAEKEDTLERFWWAYAWPKKASGHPAYCVFSDGQIYVYNPAPGDVIFDMSNVPPAQVAWTTKTVAGTINIHPKPGWTVWSHKKR